MKEKPILAFDDKNTPLTHVALLWNEDLECWSMLSLGRSEEEIKDRANHWAGKIWHGDIIYYELQNKTRVR